MNLDLRAQYPPVVGLEPGRDLFAAAGRFCGGLWAALLETPLAG